MFLVVGANGQLGNELKLILGGNAEYVDREQLDITDAAAVKAFVKPEKYAAVINCAAYTAVDKAESDAVLAEKINVDGPRHLAETGVPLLQVSTDYVFDGTGHRPYTESDEANPQSVYGVTNWPASGLRWKRRRDALSSERPGCIRLSVTTSSKPCGGWEPSVTA